MVNGKMCIGVEKERLMVRIDPGKYDEAMEKEGCTPMDFTGKVMKGFVFVDANTVTTKPKLAYWVKLALDYNKIAKVSKKKKINRIEQLNWFAKLPELTVFIIYQTNIGKTHLRITRSFIFTLYMFIHIPET